MSRRRHAEDPPAFSPHYEGPEALTALLRSAGATVDAAQAAARFAEAQGEGLDRSQVIPRLFQGEPRFGSPDEARRLYENLFALWGRVAQGAGAGMPVPDSGAPEPALPPERPELPPRGGAPAGPLEPLLVEAVWKELAALPEKELARRRDRFSNTQPDLAAWLDAVPLPESGALAASDLAFEAWAMFDQAFGDALRAARWKELAAVAAEPPALETAEPALAAYVADMLDVVEAEDPSFAAGERAQVERVIAAVAAALAGASPARR
ncbi:hypothetical protein [Anaeromyxobacter paludicola]|uniref:Uncharacterized protein n=1 Tax=Anaeromyxobacter paludicola TaxID=2918171 RepID=A0ABN6NDV6_9BACT|nr:hypothetical protein [Anaeromyxobacter paludicola]BDG10230.1 hypothetical protein AMPC_33430 [Anaeromyxobacter paludicola]